MSFESEWEQWHSARERYAGAEYGPGSLESTNWLIGMPAAVEGIPGLWALDEDGAIQGSELGTAGARVTLRVGDTLRFGRRELRVFDRRGAIALRVFNPQRAERERFSGIDTYRPDKAWRLPATFESTPGEQITVRTGDGQEHQTPLAGRLRFDLRGRGQQLAVTHRPDGTLNAVFGDGTNGVETYRFRFLPVEEPSADGAAVVDFNRAYLPPCAFSDQFVCPTPPEVNRFSVSIRAGERAVLFGR